MVLGHHRPGGLFGDRNRLRVVSGMESGFAPSDRSAPLRITKNTFVAVHLCRMERIIARPINGRSIMKRVALGLLCLLALVPASAFAQQRGSITAITPASFYSFEFEQNATITGVDLFGDLYGAPDPENIFLSTHLVVDGPAGTFNEDIS